MYELTSRYRLPSLQQRISSSRLKYATRLFQHGPSTLMHLLAVEDEISPTAWWKYVREDLAWCKSLLGDGLPTEALDPTTLAREWKIQPRLWFSTYKRAFKIAKLQETAAADVRHWHAKMVQAMHTAGMSVENLQQAGVQENSHICHCGRSFDTIQGLVSHKRLRHGYVAPEYELVGTSTSCPACLKFFWTAARLRQHLSYIPRKGGVNKCFETLRRAGYRAAPEPEDSQRELRSTWGINRRDALQAFGPHREPRDLLHDEIAAAAETADVAQRLYVEYYGEERVDLHQAEEASSAFTATTVAWFIEVEDFSNSGQAREALCERWADILQEVETEDDHEQDILIIFIHWGRSILPDLMQEWHSGYAEEWAETAFYEMARQSCMLHEEEKVLRAQNRLRSLHHQADAQGAGKPHREVRLGPQYHRGSHRQVLPVQQRYHDCDGWHAGWQRAQLHGEGTEAQLPFYRQVGGRPTYLVIHLFAGRRRADDFHDLLYQIAEGAAFDLRILSLDTAIDPVLGNLAHTGTTWRHLLRLLQDGRVAAAVAGPPCETSCPVPHTRTSGGRTGKTMASPPARFRQAVGPTTSPAQGTLSADGWIAAWSTNFSGHALHAHHWWPWPYGTPRTSPRGMESEHLPDTYCQTASSA